MALVFVDIETTGLDPQCDQILEIAWACVDPRTFEIRDCGSMLHRPAKLPESIPVRVLQMHSDNGLWADLRALPGPNTAEVAQWLEAQATSWPLAPFRRRDQKHVMAGNSVHFDMSFLRVHFPRFAECFGHQLFDVSAVLLARSAAGLQPPPRFSATRHRAAEDVMRSIAYAQWCSRGFCEVQV